MKRVKQNIDLFKQERTKAVTSRRGTNVTEIEVTTEVSQVLISPPSSFKSWPLLDTSLVGEVA